MVPQKPWELNLEWIPLEHYGEMSFDGWLWSYMREAKCAHHSILDASCSGCVNKKHKTSFFHAMHEYLRGIHKNVKDLFLRAAIFSPRN